MKNEQKRMEASIVLTQKYFDQKRFEGISRLYSARQVAEQQGTIAVAYPVARDAATAFYNRLREHFNNKTQITTFGPYTASQAVMMKRAGIEGIYLGGWATSAKGSMDEDPGADLASYPLSQVPNEAAGIVRALLTADRNQNFQRFKMTAEERAANPALDFSPFIIADADTGHGGDAHVRNLIRRFVEAGVTGYHIEDQKPGTKKCGHQGGKVLVACDEQIKRLNAARLQLDIMKVPGLIVARTDAESASLIENSADERDHPFILGATNMEVPCYKNAFLALQKTLHETGAKGVTGHQLYRISDQDMKLAIQWLKSAGILTYLEELLSELTSDAASEFEPVYNELLGYFSKTWETAARVCTFGEAVAKAMVQAQTKGARFEMTEEEWLDFAGSASLYQASEKAQELGLAIHWDSNMPRTPEGYYQIKGGIAYAIAKSLAVAPYADLLWMETKTADLEDARLFADAIHAVYPDMMLAYNLSPSFNWDTTGMTEAEMTDFPTALGKLGFVFNFITYGGHQIDGLAADEFSNGLLREGMLALAKVQRKFRLLDSPYKTPQTHVGGPRLDSALAASSGRTATTKAMGKGSTQFQHLAHTELPIAVLSDWVAAWAEEHEVPQPLNVQLRPHTPGSAILELAVFYEKDCMANMIFTTVMDRNQKQILSVRDQHLLAEDLKRKRLMTLLHLFLMNRYDIDAVHYLTPTEDNFFQCTGMMGIGIYSKVDNEVGHIIGAAVAKTHIQQYLEDPTAISGLIKKRVLKALVA